MTDLIPDVSMVDNTEERVPCVLVLDGSSSMSGERIAKLNEGLRVFEEELKGDSMACMAARVAVVRIGGHGEADLVNDFTDAMDWEAPTIEANGSTPLGKGVLMALDLIEQEKQRLRDAQITYKRPWLLILSDGAPTDDWATAAERCRGAESARRVIVFAIGIGDGANLSELSQASSERLALQLKGVEFADFFVWLSNSVSATSQAASGEAAQIPAPTGWMAVPTGPSQSV